MKKKLLTLILLLVTVFGLFAVGKFTNVEAAYNFTGHIYFEKPTSWSDSKVLLMVGHSGWSAGYEMKKVGSTNIYYYAYTSESWGGATEFAFFNTNAVWGGEGSSISHRSKYATNASRIIKESEWKAQDKGNHYLFANETGCNSWANPATDLNVSLTVSATAGGTVSATAYKFTGTNAAASNNGSSVSVIKYTDATLSATAKAGYKFVGWYSDAAYTKSVSANASHTVKDVTAATTYYAKFEPSVSLTNMFDEYYNSGVYTKETIININTANEDLKEELIQRFHAATNSLDRVQTEKTTYYSGDILWFADGHGYGKSEDNKLTSIKVENNDPTKVTVRSTTASLPGMEDYYCTLDDFVKGSHNSKHSNNETLDLVTGWTYEVDDEGNGIYKNEEANVIDAFILFTAPTWLDTDMGNYLDYTHVTVQVVGNQLVMKLWVSSTLMPVAVNTGILVSTAEVSGDYAVFSQATISKGIVA